VSSADFECHAYEWNGKHYNYGLHCIVGAVYWEDGTVSWQPSCIFCGKTYPIPPPA
jgi:hypothetical protein